MAIATVLKTGPGSSIQDLGRRGQANLGIPLSGAMDMKSFAWINHILQNEVNDAALEVSQPGFQIQFDSPTYIAIAGAEAIVRLNDQLIEKSNLIAIQSKDLLEIGAFLSGSIVYIGIKYGFKTPKILGSRSQYKGLTEDSILHKGTKIQYFMDSEASPVFNAKAKWSTEWYREEEILAYPGPDFHLLKENLREKLIGQTFRISQQSNRMGAQLLELLENDLPELPTNPVFPGTVQLTSGGKLIILLKDAQVTGGYPRILQLDVESQWKLAQKKPGSKVRFKLFQPRISTISR
ncbi:biotin-dependent carboxylase uncharacterized domain-containing protein [Algoriphagus alkaliphilus]|uniref:Biotin-dependent carboxylase uncharacterized domain-containing protein n=2 Tax=Algoriphagus alkaliphilus TaxID=279824 RepID=A0A1G5XVU0_9BACT|nr:biotin-dependent carboxylase uncharacterized domain-containing protein [Algoriphagus alkaliphilus]